MMHNKRAKKSKGFTLIEMLVVITIMAIAFIALMSIMRSMIIASNQARKIQATKADVQEATEYLTKMIKMAKLNSTTSAATSSIQITWRKPVGSTYEEVTDTINADFIQKYFSEATIENLMFSAYGEDSNNRVTMTCDAIIDAGGSAEDVVIPFETTVTLRNYAVE